MTTALHQAPRLARPRLGPSAVAIIACTVVGALLRLWTLLTHHGALFGIVGFDDGVYFGASVHLTHGVLPYRDFVLVHPPVVAEVMAPIAVFAGHVDTATLVAAARVVTALVGVASIPLTGLLLRHRGPLAVTVGCLVMAVHSEAVESSRLVLIEPYLVLFLLVALLLLFDGDQLAGSTRVLWGGIVLGVDLATKVWAIVPIAVVLAVCLTQRAKLLRVAGGVVVGFLVPCAPFLVLAPRDFFRDIVIAQLTRQGPRTRTGVRVESMLGINGFRFASVTLPVVVAIVVLLVLAAAWVRMWQLSDRRLAPLEVFTLVSTILVVAMLFVAPQYYPHYAAFLAPFLALALALPVSRIAAASAAQPLRIATAVVVAAAIATAAYSGVVNNRRVYWDNPHATAIDRIIKAGTCTVSENPSLTLAVNRFTTSGTCPKILDPLGIAILRSRGIAHNKRPTNTPAVAQFWYHAAAKADYLLFFRPALRFLPWHSPAFRQRLTRGFERVPVSGSILLFRRIGSRR